MADGRALSGECSITFIGTATTLLRLGEFTLLTDPNFVGRGQWVYVGQGMVTKRRTQPAMGIQELPALDGVVLSHLHGDHFDRVARRGLRRDLPVFTTAHAAKRLNRQGFIEPVAMRRWSQQSMVKADARLTITSLPAKHAGGVVGVFAPPVMGTLVEYQRADRPPLRLYLSGDTVLHDDLRRITDHFPNIDVAILHLGGTRVLGHLLTMDGPQGATLLETLRPQHAFPVHYDDYGLFHSPLSDFQIEVRRRGTPGVQYILRGETRALPPTELP